MNLLMKDYEINLLKNEINSLKVQIQLKDNLISTLNNSSLTTNITTSIDTNTPPPPLLLPLISTPISTNNLNDITRSNSIPASPTVPIASGSGSNSNRLTSEGILETKEQKIERKRRISALEIEILRLDSNVTKDGKRIKLEPDLQEGEIPLVEGAEKVPVVERDLNGKGKGKERRDDVEGDRQIEEEGLPPPPPPPIEEEVEMPIVPLLREPSPMEEVNGRIFSAQIQPLRLANFVSRGKDYISIGLEHHLSIGWSRKSKNTQCITIERVNDLNERGIILEFEPSSLHSASHKDGGILYTFVFNANAHEVWKSIHKALNSPIPEQDAEKTPALTFLVSDEDENQLIEGMIEPFVTATPYATYHNLEQEMEE